MPSESARPDQIADLIKELYILNRCTACRFGVCSFISSGLRDTGKLKDRVLKPAGKLSLEITFLPSESARPDQIADLIKELYILNTLKTKTLLLVLLRLLQRNIPKIDFFFHNIDQKPIIILMLH